MTRFFGLCAVGSLVLCHACTSDEAPPPGRLPRAVLPVSYQLELTVDPKQDRFTGVARIEVQINEALGAFWIHGKDLSVSDATLALDNGEVVPVQYRQATPDGVAQIVLPRTISPQTATLVLSYDAPYSDGLDGIYKVEESGESYVYTQMQPISARKAFPSFDEPGFKTPFVVKLRVPNAATAIGNMPLESEEQISDEHKLVVFQKTPKLPTYLIALAVGPFDVVEADPIPSNAFRPGELPLRGVAVKGKGAALNYALEKTREILPLVEKYFGSAHPFPKVDIAAVPVFAAGAMENVGLITFRESRLLFDGHVEIPIAQKRAFAVTMAHEIAHMWFGNLVTPAWWDDLWLNESFADWLGYRIAQEWDPQIRSDLLLFEEALDTMKEDGFSSVRTIQQPIETYHDITNSFDAITYQKGGALLHMFEQAVGPDKFREIIRGHLDRFRFGNASGNDFLESLAAGSDERTRAAFSTFLTQPGVPEITADVDCSGAAPRLRMTQTRYVPLGSNAESDSLWHVPVAIRYGSMQRREEMRVWLTSAEDTVDLKPGDCPTWMILNADGAGYYRTLFASGSAAANVNEIAQESREKERLAYADSLVARFEKGSTSAEQVLSEIDHFDDFESRALALRILRFHDLISDQILDEPSQVELKRKLVTQYGPMRDRLSADSHQNDEAKLLHVRLGDFLADVADDQGTVGELRRTGNKYVEEITAGKILHLQLDRNLAPIALNALVQAEPERYVPTLEDALKTNTNPLMRDHIVAALARVNSPASADRIRGQILAGSVPQNQVVRLLSLQTEQSENQNTTWTWVRDNFDGLTKILSEDFVGRLPEVTQNLCSRDQADEVESFFSKSIEPFSGGPRNLQKAVERIRSCASVKERHQEDLNRLF